MRKLFGMLSQLISQHRVPVILGIVVVALCFAVLMQVFREVYWFNDSNAEFIAETIYQFLEDWAVIYIAFIVGATVIVGVMTFTANRRTQTLNDIADWIVDMIRALTIIDPEQVEDEALSTLAFSVIRGSKLLAPARRVAPNLAAKLGLVFFDLSAFIKEPDSAKRSDLIKHLKSSMVEVARLKG